MFLRLYRQQKGVAIVRANKFLYNLTHSQKGIWYTEKIYPDTGVGVVAGTFRMKGNIDYEVLEKAINAFVRDNDAMRIRIVEEKGEPLQYVADYEPFVVDFKDFSCKDINELYDWEREQTIKPMCLIDCSLFSFTMLRISDNEGGYYIKTYHAISDAWSMTLVANKIVKKYTELLSGEDKEEMQPSYVEYIKSEEEYKKSPKYIKDHEYWMNKYATAPEITTLKPKTSKDISIAAKRKTFVLPEKLCKKLYEYSKENKASVFSIYVAALSMYLYRVTGKENLNFGTIILNRGNFKEKDTMGMFVTTVPISLDIKGENNFADFSRKVTGEMMSLMRHQSYPFDILQEELRQKFNFEDVLYDIVLSYQNAKFLGQIENFDYKSRWHFCGYQSNSLTVHINDRENDGKLIIDYDYLKDLFYDKEIEFLHDHIERILWHALDNPTKELKKLEMVSEIEKSKILYDFNNTKTDYQSGKAVQELIEDTVNRLPDKVAIIFEGKTITYSDLNKRANIVANKLRACGIGRNDIVGLMANRSIDMMIGLFGIMKSGAAYLPIDPEYPQERIEYMLKDSNSKLLITQEQLEDLVKADDITRLFLEKDFAEGNENNPEIINNPNDLIYVIYTSGSTGKPKGVMLKHNNVNNFIKGACDQIDFNENKVIVSVTTICFDIFVLESWLALQKGLTVVLANEEEQNSPKLFNALCLENNVNMIQTTPSRTAVLISNKKYLKYVEKISEFMVGGEPFPEALLKNLREISNAKIYNMYGPTETTVWSSIKDLSGKDKINIGKPMANTEFYVLDKTLNLCPIGMIGDLYIGGAGIAKGYIGKEQLTKERFIQNPYKENDVIYNTGDLARWMSSGEISHMGRSDFQVKIRGYRIELGDIQKNLIKIEGIKDAIIKAVDNKYLIAYLICNDKVNVTQIKNELLKVLPQYMIPSYFIRVKKFMYTPNGKVDTKRLPDINETDIMREVYIAARTKTEKQLAEIWENLLGLKKISIQDNFFDIGGDSLGAINLSNKISDEFGVSLSVKEVYENFTIEKMAMHLDEDITLDLDKKYSDVVLLKRSDSKENLFVIHAGNGSVAPYANLMTKVNANFNCIGIEFPESSKAIYYPLNIDMEKTVEEYIERIRKVQAHGPYKFLGWCVGCSVIIEVIKQLERVGEEVEEVYLIAGVAPELNEKIIFDKKTETFLVKLFGFTEKINEEIEALNFPENIWNKVIEYVDELDYDNTKQILEKVMHPLELSRATQNYAKADLKDIIKNFNLIRTMVAMHAKYNPEYITNTKCYYFNPIQDIILGDQQLNKSKWKNFFTDMSIIDLEGDHFSFFENGTDEEFVKILNNLLSRKEYEV